MLVELVDTPSPSGEERKCAELLVEFFENNDREVWIDGVGNVRAPGNEVLLTSHIDTVPGDLEVKVEDGTLHGRGSVDAKGPLATMAVVAVNTGADFAGVVREETDSKGAEYLTQDMEEPGYVINGEPTGWNGIALGYRGSIVGVYSVEEELFHSSRPEPNAIQRAVSFWSRIEDEFAGDGFEAVNVKPLSIDGGQEEGLSTRASIRFQVRVPPAEKIEDVKNRIEEHMENGSIEWLRSTPPVMKSPRSEIARIFRSGIRDIGGEPRMIRKTGTCDMNRYAEVWDCPMATYGPGNSELDHTPGERLDLGDFEKSVRVLENLVEELTD